MRPALAWLVLLAMLDGCAPLGTGISHRPATAQALSLRGDTLWTLPVDPQQGPRIVRQLNEARNRVAAGSAGVLDQVMLARRTAAIGRLREAVAILDRTAEMHFLDPLVLRQRGEWHLRLRELRRARADFEQALALTADTTRLADLVELPQGEMVSGSSIQFHAALYLAITCRLEGRDRQVEAALEEAMRQAGDHDDLTEATLWAGLLTGWRWAPAQREAIVRELEEAATVTAHRHEFAALLGLTGAFGPGFALERATRGNDDDRALFGLGLAIQHLAEAHPDSAASWLHRVLETPNWAALPYLVAEAEQARLGR